MEKQDRTTRQLTDKLKQQGFEDEDIEEAIAYVQSYHYLDDERYARNYVRYGSETKCRWKLKTALQQKGIPQDLIDLALEEEFQGDERKLIRQFLDKKDYNHYETTPELRQKLVASLFRRGFRLEDIKAVMGECVDEF